MADIEAHIKDFTKQQKTEYLRSLTAEDNLRYKRYKDNQRQKKYKQNPENRKKANELSRVRMEELRTGEPEKYKEMNREHNQTYNKKIRAIKAKAEALNKISDAIKAKKARKEAEIKAVEKATATAEKLTQKQQEIKQIITEANKTMDKAKKKAVKKATTTAETITKQQDEIKQMMTRAKTKADEALKKLDEAKKNIQNNTTPTPKRRGAK
jgi:chromosome segregation ATPase